MDKLERRALGQEEKPWPRSLIEKDELEKWQKYICDLSNVFLCAVDENGVPLTELGGNPQETEKIERLIDGEQFQSMLGRVAESELEDRAVERTAYPNLRLAVVTSRVEKKPVVNWLVCGIMDDSKDDGEYENPPLEGFSCTLGERQFLRAVDAIKAITDALLAERLLSCRSRNGQEKSVRLEQRAGEQLKCSELLRDMMWLLGDAAPASQSAETLLKKAGEHLQLDIAVVYCREQGQSPQMTAKWNKKDISWGFESDRKLPWPSLLTAERNLILSSNTMLGDEEKEEMEALALKALITMPMKMEQAKELWVCFGVSEKERVWELDEIRFLGEAVRILQGILTGIESREAPRRRNTSGPNKRKKK